MTRSQWIVKKIGLAAMAIPSNDVRGDGDGWSPGRAKFDQPVDSDVPFSDKPILITVYQGSGMPDVKAKGIGERIWIDCRLGEK